MKEHESIKKLFQLYISGKHFSQTGRALFGKWLRAPQDQETKEDQLWHSCKYPWLIFVV